MLRLRTSNKNRSVLEATQQSNVRVWRTAEKSVILKEMCQKAVALDQIANVAKIDVLKPPVFHLNIRKTFPIIFNTD